MAIPLVIPAAAAAVGFFGGMFSGAQVDDALEGGKNAINPIMLVVYVALAYFGWKLFKKLK